MTNIKEQFQKSFGYSEAQQNYLDQVVEANYQKGDRKTEVKQMMTEVMSAMKGSTKEYGNYFIDINGAYLLKSPLVSREGGFIRPKYSHTYILADRENGFLKFKDKQVGVVSLIARGVKNPNKYLAYYSDQKSLMWIQGMDINGSLTMVGTEASVDEVREAMIASIDEESEKA